MGCFRCGLYRCPLRAERRMGGRLDAGCGDLARPNARPRPQLRSLGLGHRCRACRHNRDVRRYCMGMARRVRGAGDNRSSGNLRPAAVPGVTLLGAHAGSQAAYSRRHSCRCHTQRGRSRVDRENTTARLASTVSARSGSQYRYGNLRRQSGIGLVQHRGFVDAAVPVAAARVVDRRVRQLLYLLGIVRDDSAFGPAGG
jgi:hypothetical protein